MSEAQTVRSNLEEHVGFVELARPPHNFIDAETLADLADALDALSGEAACRAIVIAAEGKSFCAGANFAATGAPASAEEATPAEMFRALGARIYAQAERIFAVKRPMVAAVHGAAVGAGVGLALACDLRVACPHASFRTNFVQLGIHPGFAISETLPALVGPGRAADLLLTGRRVGGEEALSMGLVDRIVPQAEVRAGALTLAKEIASAAPLAVAATRATLRAGLAERVRVAMARELDEQVRLFGTADALEGIAAMLSRREPRFEGR